ncbi:TPA: hypothetical protein DCR49_07380 [Candidatus Delongbacteria bacterium]|nr:hypothetical protein [Candidatus Delongbacteria bacterium]
MSSEIKKVQTDIESLIDYLHKEDYKGYDPYDTLNSWFPFNIFGGRWGQVAAVQFQLRNPVNIRPLLGIKKERGVKSIALILQAMSVYYRVNPSEELKKKMDFLFEWILSMRLKGDWKGSCWAVHFPLAMKDKSRVRFDPSAVLASFVAESLYEYYLSTKNEKVTEVMKGICDFIFTHVPVTERPEGSCYSYTTKVKDIVFNANSFVAETFAKTYALTKNETLKEEAIKCLDFNIFHQKDDGRWTYSMNSKTGGERELIDFHQGFILNSIYDIIKILSLKDEKYEKAIIKGLSYYRKHQFYDDGSSVWRVPKKHPVDIHNQGVGIMTFSKLSEYSEEYLNFAGVIAEWTDKNMRNEKEGYYYYLKHPLHTNKISFIRWNQAWMLLGMANLYAKLKGKENE